ncbi:MAG: AraC family transcriptional regulator [Paraglaciecola sp.]|nr:AraC family transcriptional regulator [Paraglaciecola sp.]
MSVRLCFIVGNTMSSLQQISRINDVLYFIHQDISQLLLAKELAVIAAYSEQHFHRVFCKVVGESVHQYIRRARLEFAANQLMFDDKSSILEVANKAGFVSVSSFSRAFKTVFMVSPGQWRQVGKQRVDQPYLADAEIAANYKKFENQVLPQVKLVQLPERRVAYVRHQGYGRSIKLAWQKLQAWANAEQRDFSQQFALYHSNPAWVELSECRYVACVQIDKPLLRRTAVNSLHIPGGLHAVFSLTGKYGELLPQLSKILQDWLPQSGFKMLGTPAFVYYKKNQFLTDDEAFDLDFCLPISLF